MKRSSDQNRHPRVLVAIPSAGADGRDRLTGIFRHLGADCRWDVILPSSHRPLAADFVRETLAHGLDGVLVAEHYDAAIARLLTRARVPTVALHDSWIHRPGVGSNFRFVLTDHVAVGRLAARHFLSLGRFAAYGFIGDTERNRWGLARQLGFTRELKRHALEASIFTPAASSQRLLDRGRFERWLGQRPTPLALFSASDRIAIQALDCCHALDLTIPTDVAILGVDNDEMLIASSDPPLSSILPNFTAAGQEAAQILEDILSRRLVFTQIISGDALSPNALMGNASSRDATKSVPKVKLFAPLKLVERASTAPRSPAAKLVENARAAIAAHALDGLTPSLLAARLHVSRQLLDLRFRELRAGTISAAIRARRLDEVARLLRETDYSVRQIGRLCGFANERSLKNIFRHAFKTTMTAYRQFSRARTHSP